MRFKKYLLTILLLLPLWSLPLFGKSYKSLYIAVEEIGGKEKPSFWAKENVTFYYSEKVDVLDRKGSWVNVYSKKGNRSGWIKESATTTKKLKATSFTAVDAEELALAGKGFSNSFSVNDDKTNKNALNYSDMKTNEMTEKLLDEIETVPYTQEELRSFIIDGKLKGGE